MGAVVVDVDGAFLLIFERPLRRRPLWFVFVGINAIAAGYTIVGAVGRGISAMAPFALLDLVAGLIFTAVIAYAICWLLAKSKVAVSRGIDWPTRLEAAMPVALLLGILSLGLANGANSASAAGAYFPIAFVCFLIVWVGQALLTGLAAERKGRDRGSFAGLALLVPVIIWIVVAALPPLIPNQLVDRVAVRRCPNCSTQVLEQAIVCHGCGADVRR